MPQRTPTGQSLPGHTGNPGGRPGLPNEVRALLSELSLPAVQVLADALRGDDPRVRVVAAAHILDRLYGRPAQATDLTLKAEAIDASAAHLAALVAAARRRDPGITHVKGHDVVIHQERDDPIEEDGH